MLFQVEMDVQFPHNFPAERADESKQAERDRARICKRPVFGGTCGEWRDAILT